VRAARAAVDVEVVVAFLLALPCMALALRLGRGMGLVDRPGGIKIHRTPIPFTGGAGILVTLVAVGAYFGVSATVLAAAIAVWAVGFLDDIRHLSPAQKIIFEFVPLAVATSTVSSSFITILLLTTVAVVLLNAYAVLDGLDALAAGVMMFSLLPLAFVSGPAHLVAAITVGCSAAFLVFNMPPARLFLGNHGSLLLGLLMWVVVLRLSGEGALTMYLAAASICSVPLVNVAFVVARRIGEKRPVLGGDRAHLYDVLHRRLGLWSTVILSWTLSAVAGVIATELAR